MVIQSRQYQLEAATAVEAEWAKGNRKTLMVCPTGTGKTIIFCRLAENVVRQGGKVLILAHRGELLQQAADKMSLVTGLGCSVEKAESNGHGEWFQITVGSVQTMMRENRLTRFKSDHWATIIVDEAHHVLADSYQKILEYYDTANVLGVTATPDRGDMKELGQFFDSLAYEYTLPRAIKEGYLCPIKALTIPLKIDLNNVTIQSGDFRARDVGNALDPYLYQIADHMVEHCRNRKTVVFLPLIATSQKFEGILREKGMKVAEVNGESKDRGDILRDFDRGRYQVICNSMLLTEGWDCPTVDCIVCLRPTKIRSLYAQICGRGTRISEGKDHLLLLDFLWLSERHELCRPAHLIAQDADVAKKMTKTINDAGCPMDLEAVEKDAATSCVEERESKLAEELARKRNRKSKLVDPLVFAMSIQDESLASYVPAFGWEAEPVTTQQKNSLEKLGIYPDEMNQGQAEVVLHKLHERIGERLSTPKQIRFLESKGFRHVGTWEFGAARRLIDRIAASNWRVPAGVNPATYRPKSEQEALL